jgi:colicin import membrane protein
MSSTRPEILFRSNGDRGLVWNLLASLLLHVGLIAILLFLPNRFFKMRADPVSYSVDLVSSGDLGGNTGLTNRGSNALKPVPRNAPVAPAPREQGKQARRPPAQPKADLKTKTEKKAVAKKPAPQVAKVAPEVSAKPALPPREKSEPKPPAPAAKPEPDTFKSVAPVPEKVAKPATARKEKPKAAEPEKAAPPPSAVVRQETKTEATKPAQASERTEPKRAEGSVEREPRKAVEGQRAKRPVAESDAEKRNRAIAAAVARRAEQLVRAQGGAGAVASARPGAASVGPGEGSGGVVRGLEYLLYYNAMIKRIKENWVWTGGNPSLEAVVQFNLTAAGDVINVRTVRPSGDASYDASVERAVRAASPLGPPPERYRAEFSTVELTFRPEDLRS